MHKKFKRIVLLEYIFIYTYKSRYDNETYSVFIIIRKIKR